MVVITVLSSLSLATPVYAATTPFGARVEERLENRAEAKAEREDKESTKPGLLNRIANLKARASIGTGAITSKSGTTFTFTKEGKSYTVNTDSKTQFRRKFWGKSSFDELTVGDTVNVIGLWIDDAHTTITAKLVRDTSIQKRFGVFFGEVKSLLSSGWVMSTVSEKRADQTVTVDSSTKFTNRKGETITQSQVTVGQKVRVKGLWNRTNNTVTEVTQVKDFSLPLQGSVSATITVSPTQ